MAATPLSRFTLRTDERGGFRTAALPADSAEFAMLQELWDTGAPRHNYILQAMPLSAVTMQSAQ